MWCKQRDSRMDLKLVSQVFFAIDGVVNTSLYIPQVRKSWRVPQGTALSTWAFWAVTSADGVFFAAVAAQNTELLLVMIGNLVGCAGVFLAAWVARARERKKDTAPRVAGES
jgi:hypothetical protein